MSPENDKLLTEKYPELLRQRSDPKRQSCMAFGYECGDGWFKILDELFAQLTFLAKLGIKTEVAQVKEKFGALRIYVDMINYRDFPEDEAKICSAIVDGLVGLAENWSRQTCEMTGEYGSMYHTPGGWLKTLSQKWVQEHPERGFLPHN